MDLDKSLQYGLRSGPTKWIKIRPNNIYKDQALQDWLSSGPTLWI